MHSQCMSAHVARIRRPNAMHGTHGQHERVVDARAPQVVVAQVVERQHVQTTGGFDVAAVEHALGDLG